MPSVLTKPTSEIWNLRNVELFNELTPSEMEQVLEVMPTYSYRAGEYVFLAGQQADSLFVLQVGTVKVSYITLNGDEKVRILVAEDLLKVSLPAEPVAEEAPEEEAVAAEEEAQEEAAEEESSNEEAADEDGAEAGEEDK